MKKKEMKREKDSGSTLQDEGRLHREDEGRRKPGGQKEGYFKEKDLCITEVRGGKNGKEEKVTAHSLFDRQER